VIRGLLAALLLTISLVGVAAPASAATTETVAITGSVQCTQRMPVEGIWVNSSLGGSGWAGRITGHDATVNYFRYPSSGTISLPYGTYISLHVGCGGNTSTWASDNLTGNVVLHYGGHLIVNAYSCQPPKWVSGQTVQGSCSLPPEGTLGSSTTNPFGTAASGGKGYCTCGAAYMWFKNTGWYPAWTGDASGWATNAQALHWTVFTYPAEHALIVWPGLDHVGYVTSINIATDTLTFMDMNGGNAYINKGAQQTNLFGEYDAKTCPLSGADCTSSRQGNVSVNLSGASFIVANPGYDWSWGSAAYPTPSPDCVP
jgi:hypothetical protein